MSVSFDTVFKIGIVVSALIASSGVGYYYGIHLPARDRQLDAERRLEVDQVAEERLAEEQRVEAERVAEEQKKAAQQEIEQARSLEQQRALAAKRAASQQRYELCMSQARRTYSANWASACTLAAERETKIIDACVSEKRSRLLAAKDCSGIGRYIPGTPEQLAKRRRACMGDTTSEERQMLTSCYEELGKPDPSPECALPQAVAEIRNTQFEKDKDRCLREQEAGL